MKVDSNIVKAINKYIADNGGTASNFAKKLNVSAPTIIKWQKVGNGITKQRWQVLFEHIKNYLPKESISIDDAGDEHYYSNLKNVDKKYFSPRYVPMMLPLISLKTASQYPGMLESFQQYAKNASSKTVELHATNQVPAGMFAIEINTSDWAPSLPKGATVFVAGNENPSNGDLVFIQTQDNRVLFATYEDKNSKVNIKTVDNSKKIAEKITFKKTDVRKHILWIFPVVSYEVKLRR